MNNKLNLFIGIKKELWKDKNIEEVKHLHKQLDMLRKQSFEELISVRKERDDMSVKVQQIEKELFRTKKKLKAAQSEVSRSRETRNESKRAHEEHRILVNTAKDEEKFISDTIKNEMLTNINQLREQLINKENEFEVERTHMRELIKQEKLKVAKLEGETLTAKNMYEKKKNTVIKETIEKDEIIHSLTNELNELKTAVRVKEIMKVETQLKDLNRVSIDRSLFNYDTNEMKLKTNRDLSRSRSPFLNDNNISDIMYLIQKDEAKNSESNQSKFNKF